MSLAEDPSKLRFRPKARIIRTIGDQLISGPEAAVIELVKNAYDADASRVTIVFTPPLTAGQGRISVADDGHGMTRSDIEQKWMEPATSAKVRDRRSRVKRRLMMGSKGIGRFAAAKLGRKMFLRSISDDEHVRNEVLIGEIDWNVFSDDKYLADISIDCESQPTSDATGTEIEIHELVESWSKEKLSRLLLQLRRLISPLEISNPDDSFKIYLDLSACTESAAGFDGAGLVNGSGVESAFDLAGDAAHEVKPFPLLTACDYEVSGKFDDQGKFAGTMEIRRGHQSPEKITLNIPLQDEEDICGPFGVHLFIFDREAESLKANMERAGLGQLSAADARKIVDNVTGIAVYRDGFRVRPYGDEQNDWLTLDKRRVQDPSLRIGHNQVAGYVTVQGQDGSLLIERSSREGFEENGAFRRLHRLVSTLLSEVVEPRRKVFREKAGLSRSRTTTFDEVRELAGLKKIRELISKLPESQRLAAASVIDKESTLLSNRISALEDRQRLLEAKSSLGAIIGEILHEGTAPVGYIVTTSARLQRLWPDVISSGPRAESAKQDFPRKLHFMRENGQRLSALFDALRPLSGGRRGAPKFFRPIEPVAAAKELFAGHGIPIQIQGGAEAPPVIGYPDDLATAVINLLGNSIYWLEQAKSASPSIDVVITYNEKEVQITIEDNGPGVPGEFIEHIFDVGFTLKNGGTGLGLNIAKEALSRSGAILGFDVESKGGARFIIIFDREGVS